MAKPRYQPGQPKARGLSQGRPERPIQTEETGRRGNSRSVSRSVGTSRATEVVRYRDDIGFLEDWSRALSRGGVFVNTRRIPRTGQTVAIHLLYPGRNLSVLVQGRVQWRRTADNEENLPPGVFVTLDRSDDVSQRLEALADRLACEGVQLLCSPPCWNPEGFASGQEAHAEQGAALRASGSVAQRAGNKAASGAVTSRRRSSNVREPPGEGRPRRQR